MTTDPITAVLTHLPQVLLAVAFAVAWLLAEFFARRSTFQQGAVRRPSSAMDHRTYPIIGIALGLGLVVSVIVFLFGVGGYLPFWSSGIGVVLMLIGLPLRIWALMTLGKFFTMPITIRDDHRIIQNGPYRWLRHPSYTANFLLGIGMPLILGTWVGFLFSFAACAIAYAYRISREEQVLLGRFGEEYRTYSSHTWRLVPYLY